MFKNRDNDIALPILPPQGNVPIFTQNSLTSALIVLLALLCRPV
jgi:hypothetical protein